MSQEKVAKYKEAKANRKEIMKKEKRERQIRNAVVAFVCLAALGWVGVSAVTYLQDNKAALDVEVDYSAIDEYTDNLANE